MEQTLKQIADELGIDKQRVYRYVTRHRISDVHQRCGVMYIGDTAKSQITSHFLKNGHISDVHHNRITSDASDTVSDAVIDMLKRELEIKNKQIEDLSAALVAAQQTAQAAQALHAGTMQQQLGDGEGRNMQDPVQKQKELEAEITRLRQRTLWQRIFNKD